MELGEVGIRVTWSQTKPQQGIFYAIWMQCTSSSVISQVLKITFSTKSNLVQ